jgi:thioredoxin reductase (NADPH)
VKKVYGMSDALVHPLAPIRQSDEERTFPHLNEAQIAKLAASGRTRAILRDETLIRVGERTSVFFVVLSGEVTILHPGPRGHDLVVAHGPGQFTGEVSLLSGQPSLVEARVTQGGEVVEIDRVRLLEIVQRDAAMGELLLRAFILRRTQLVASGLGDVVVVGSRHCPGTLRVREFLERNGHPYTMVDLDSDTDVQSLLDRFLITPGDIPVLICRGEHVLRNPSNSEIADCLELNEPTAGSRLLDLVVVGAGPAGLSAAVYAASEGLDVMVVESRAPGGQAGASSKIENYLGFPTGISGQALASRALTQAQKFGASVLVGRTAARLECHDRSYVIHLDAEGALVRARSVVIATGARYRKPVLEGLARFEGLGVYYAATFMEAQGCAGQDVLVIGGGNSAGQAAVFLAETARRVHLLVRGADLTATMSRYLIRRIEDHPRIELHLRMKLLALEGDSHVARATWRSTAQAAEEGHSIQHVFVMTGAEPATSWLDGNCIALDAKGFIKTGPDLGRDDLNRSRWSRARAPYLLETSTPGIFAVGDVRSGNVKRVASAVGEGSIALALVHRVLTE